MTIIGGGADRKSLYRTGGISALVIGFAYVAIIALYVPVGAPPSGSEAWLAYVSANPMTWWAIIGLSVLTDFLFIPVVLSLYTLLKDTDRNGILLASVCVALFVVLDLAITWTNYAALLTLSSKYSAAVSAADRAAVITAAEYPCAVLESKLLFVYNTLTLAAGIGITGLVMRKSPFGRTAAYLGLATGVLGFVSVAGSFLASAPGVTIIATSVLTTIWLLVTGYTMHQLGRYH